ncbi:MAG: hypothetical protein ABIH37_04280 [archaeon]
MVNRVNGYDITGHQILRPGDDPLKTDICSTFRPEDWFEGSTSETEHPDKPWYETCYLDGGCE